MKKLCIVLSLMTVSSVLSSCFKNPVTGRSSLNLAPESDMQQLAVKEYSSFIGTNRPLAGNDAEMVKRVGNKMVAAVKQFLQERGKLDLIAGYNWEFNLVNSNEVNAWCMPGGKVAVYTGILPITQNETGLAVVMGHEIAHAIARHGNERVSQQLFAQYGGQALSVLMSSKPAETQQIFNYGVGATSTLGILAFSRKHESEADEMGLYFMAMAGYNPEEAISFWQRMAAKGGQKPPQFLSTHPSDETRISQLKGWMPKAKALATH